MATLKVDDKWSVQYDPENNDCPVNILRHGEVSGAGLDDWKNDSHAMFYAILDRDAEIARLQSRLQAMTENADRLAKYLLDAQHYDFDWNGAIDALATHRKLMEEK